MNHETIIDLKDKKVALLGYGVEHRAVLPYLQKLGATITICDKNAALDAPAGTELRLGDDYLKSLTDFEIIFRSPGIPYLTREIQEARQAGVIITSQTQYFLSRCPAKVIGVTGTKGKSTASALIAQMLQAAHGLGEIEGNVYLAGNIGRPPITVLDQLQSQDWVVLELSSFQLQDVTVSPHIAVVLNVTIDHLDHHKDEAEYISAKKNIVRYQKPSDWLVVNLDSTTSLHFADETPAQVCFYSRQHSVDQGSFIAHQAEADKIILRLPGRSEEIIGTTADVALPGPYNQENVTAAATAAALAGASSHSLLQTLKAFTGLPHRLQLVAERRGVSYYDDSKSTTPDSTIAAIQAFTQPITLIVGGSAKGADFSELVAAIITSTVTTVICIGQEGERLFELLQDQSDRLTVVRGDRTMSAIVAQATKLTVFGGVVLLSPAAASLDMFKNAEDRGDQFQEAVKALS